MKIIGLTGGIASGKSTVTKLLRQRGIAVIDADDLAREVVEPGGFGAKALLSYFGPGVFENGSLNRHALREQVFQSEDRRLLLERLLHPLIQWRSDQEFRKLKEQGGAMAFYDAPLLFEKNQEHRFDSMVCVAADRERQIERLVGKRGLSRPMAESIVAAQLPMAEKRARAQFVIDNNSSEENLTAQIDQMLGALGLV